MVRILRVGDRSRLYRAHESGRHARTDLPCLLCPAVLLLLSLSLLLLPRPRRPPRDLVLMFAVHGLS